jgi:mgtE-like transporter
VQTPRHGLGFPAEAVKRPGLRRPLPLPPPLRWLGIFARAVVGPPARAVRGTARRVGDPLRQVVDYWASQRETMRQGFVAHCISAATSLVAGVTLAGMGARIEDVAGLFVLIPVSIGMRGNIFGALAARLGTSIHSGLFEVSRDRRGLLYQNILGATLLTVATSAAMGLVARAIAGLIGVPTVSAWDLMVVAMVGGLLSSALVLACTIYLSVISFRRRWDLDSVGAVLITTVGDVVTLPCLLAASYLVGLGWASPVLGGVALAAGIASVWAGWTTPRAMTRRIVRESFPVLIVAIVLDVLAGAVVEPRLAHLLTLPAFLLLLPGFLARTGALGSILAARLGSKLHLGAVTASARPDAVALLDASIVLVQGVTVYAVTALLTLALAVSLGYATGGALDFVGVTMLGGVMATVVASLIGYYAAIAAFRFGFDPDNQTIPVVTSGMDLLGIICLVVALAVFGVV